MPIGVEGEVVLVTGGTGALGQAVTKALLDDGAYVAVTYRDAAEWRALQERVEPSSSARLSGFQADLGDDDQVKHVVDSVVQRAGSVDALVALAGGFAAGTTWETEHGAWKRMFDLNLMTLVTAVRHVVPVMKKQGRGRIVATSAASVLEAGGGGAGMAAYAVSKAAVVKLVEVLAGELRHDGITVHCVAPGTMDTPANRKSMPEAEFSTWVKPTDIANVVRFLVSEDARAIRSILVPITN
jgi:NAD(P)-dependent dehydrogenase (short-subunit alcohol dehydrogenase family)